MRGQRQSTTAIRVNIWRCADKVATPAGKRSNRVVVGIPFGSDAVNDAVAPIQRSVIEGLGLGSLEKLNVQ